MESEKHGGSTVSTLNLLRAGSLHTDEQTMLTRTAPKAFMYLGFDREMIPRAM